MFKAEQINPIQNEKDFNLSEAEAEETFYSLLDELNRINPDLGGIWEKRLDNEEVSAKEACIKLKEVLAKRRNIESFGVDKAEKMEKNKEIVVKGRRIMIDDVKLAESIPDNLLGNGSVARAYSLPGYEGLVCVKIVHNPKRYAEGNSIHKEAEFLKKLGDFSAAGVRSPYLYSSYNNLGLTFIIMEELDAANFRLVLEGNEDLPPSFHLEEFFKRLKEYLTALHKEGIYHLDFALRNIMIDRKTGFPYVIDFGKSKFKDDLLGEKFDDYKQIYAEKDWAGFEACLNEAKNKIKDNKAVR